PAPTTTNTRPGTTTSTPLLDTRRTWDVCRENGVEHLLTKPRSPTTTGKIERFHRTLRAEFDTSRTFTSLTTAQAALNEWVDYYNTQRPHQALEFDTPRVRFEQQPVGATDPSAVPARLGIGRPDRDQDGWVTRKVCSNGVVCVSWQQVSVGVHRAGQQCDVFVTPELLQFWIGEELVKTVIRTSTGEVRKKQAAGTSKRN
ncbi:MAG: transposase, partial [Nocardioidaceae bacterium]|nr:transposase [Nocardioidaceae bacterium]